MKRNIVNKGGIKAIDECKLILDHKHHMMSVLQSDVIIRSRTKFSRKSTNVESHLPILVDFCTLPHHI